MMKLAVLVCSSKLDRDVSDVSALVEEIRLLHSSPILNSSHPQSRRLSAAMIYLIPAPAVSSSELYLDLLVLQTIRH